MKQIVITGLAVIMDVSDNADKKEVQEHLDLMNLNLIKNSPTGQIVGVDSISDGDISLWGT
jgi:hypothetical protein